MCLPGYSKNTMSFIYQWQKILFSFLVKSIYNSYAVKKIRIKKKIVTYENGITVTLNKNGKYANKDTIT